MSENSSRNNLFDFVGKYSYCFLFVVLEAFSLVLLFRFNSYQGSVYFTAANSVVAGVNGAYEDVIGFFHLQEVNRQLTDQNIALQRETEQ